MSADIPEQPKTARSTSQFDDDLRVLADTAPDLGLIVTDAEHKVIRWSAGAEKVTGWDEAEAVGRKVDALLSNEETVAKPTQNPRTDSVPSEERRWHLRKDGTPFWGTTITTPLYDRNTGVLRGYGRVLRDQTTEKRLEDQLRGLFDDSLDAVLIVGDTTSHADSSPTSSAPEGLGEETVLGRHIFDLLPADSDSDAEAHWRDFLSRLGPEGKVRIVQPDGITVETRYRARTDPVPDRQIRALRQVSQRRRTEQALRASEARLAAIFAHAAVGLSEIGLDGKFLQVNDELCRILARPREELVGAFVPTVTHPDDVPNSLNALARTVETGGPVSFDKRYLRPDGSQVWGNSSLTLLRDAKGNPRAVLAVTVDLSQRKRQEDELRALFEESLDALLIADDDAVLVDANPAASALFGQERKNLVGKRIFELFPPETRATAEPLWVEFLSRGHQEGMLRLIRPDGTPVEVEYRARAHYVPGRHLSVMRDVTTRWHAELALRASEQALREANETLETRVTERTRVLEERTAQLQKQTADLEHMSAVRRDLLRRLVTTEEQERRRISRELHDQTGQHLTGLVLGLKSFEDTLRTSGPLDGEANALLLNLRSLADELARDIHRIAVELRPTALDDLGLMPALRSHVERWAKSHSVRAEFDSFGMSDDIRLMEIVETTVYRVVQEALTNIAKYANGGPGKATSVSVTLQMLGGYLQATVEDNGPGFDQEAAGRLGRLGVAGMRERAAACGGTLEIESTPGMGTTVFLRIPVKQS